jgi:hypothetical protein
VSFTSTPKTLAERLQWMADNLPGFREELDAVREIKRRQYAKSVSGQAHHIDLCEPMC